MTPAPKPFEASKDQPMIKYFQSGSRMSQAVVYGGLVHIAGQVANDRKAGLESLTSDVLAKIDALLAEAGTSKSRLVAVNIFLPQIGDFEAMNAIYDAWVDREHLPARACVEARLADPDLRIEITAVAAV
jgi:enamine deaminase RidA (YjgF/YER057c/UK114 family)